MGKGGAEETTVRQLNPGAERCLVLPPMARIGQFRVVLLRVTGGAASVDSGVTNNILVSR